MEKRKPHIRITLRIPPDVHEAITMLADESGESLNAEIINRLRDSLKAESPEVINTTEKLLRRVIREELDNQKS